MRSRVAWALVAGLLFHAAAAALFGGPPDLDAWFHARIARMMLSGEAPWHGLSFPWITCSAWAAFPSDWALGWHWFVAPFTAFGDPMTGLAAAQVVVAGVLTAVFHRLQIRAGVARPWLWTALLLAGSASWLIRTHMDRPTPAVIVALLVLLGAAIEARPVAAAVAACAAMLIYNVPTTPLLVGACGCLGAFARDHRVPWRTGLAIVGAVAAGAVLHPGMWSVGPGGWLSADHASVHVWRLFGGSVDFAARGGSVVADLGGGNRAEFQIALPAELLSPAAADYLTGLRVPLLATAAAALVALTRRRDGWAVGTAAAAAACFAMTERSGRFFEYWHPFAALAAAAALGRGAHPGDAAPAPRIVAASAVLLIAAEVPLHVEAFRTAEPALGRQVAPAAASLVRVARPGDIVFQGAWDDFAPCFHHAPGVRWIAGMDPWFFVAHDPSLVAWHAAAIGGLLSESDLRTVIVERFHARFVLLWRRPGREQRYAALEDAISRASWATVVHRDAAVSVFEVR